LLWRPRDEAAAAGGGLQGVRREGQGEGVAPPGSQVVQAQVLPHLEFLTTERRCSLDGNSYGICTHRVVGANLWVDQEFA